jgi:hypothetical protein
VIDRRAINQSIAEQRDNAGNSDRNFLHNHRPANRGAEYQSWKPLAVAAEPQTFENSAFKHAIHSIIDEYFSFKCVVTNPLTMVSDIVTYAPNLAQDGRGLGGIPGSCGRVRCPRAGLQPALGRLWASSP